MRILLRSSRSGPKIPDPGRTGDFLTPSTPSVDNLFTDPYVDESPAL